VSKERRIFSIARMPVVNNLDLILAVRAGLCELHWLRVIRAEEGVDNDCHFRGGCEGVSSLRNNFRVASCLNFNELALFSFLFRLCFLRISVLG
jgi:hypothetical protein